MNDLDKYEFCMRYARTMMMMAKLFEERYGKEDSSFIAYVQRGIESCRKAKKYKSDWDDNKTVILKIVA